MIIALDYDDTYTADPDLWDSFIENAVNSGHRVIVVTCRRDTRENRDECRVPDIAWNDHFFTNLSPKRWYMEDKEISVDIWIDDLPESIKEGR